MQDQDGGRFALERVKRRLAETRGEKPWQEAARDLELPPARLREVVAFYPELTGADAETRVCAGTSCFLSGGAAIAAALPQARAVHCLGHCDRSPCAVGTSGIVQVDCDAKTVQEDLSDASERRPERPFIRCTAPEAIVTRHLGEGVSSTLDAARRRGAYNALEMALSGTPAEVLRQVEESESRGRGGAGFPTGAKWAAAGRVDGKRVVVANGDEGDPGSFVDRILLEEDPHSVIEGLALSAFAIGAPEGIVFVRSEYPRALEQIRTAISEAEAHGLLGEQILGSNFSFSVHATSGLGSYVAGEETALLQTLEGRAGEVRLRPPYPVESGLDGRPTVVNNVETLVSIPWIVGRGAEAYRRLGTEHSRGTVALCLNAGFEVPGILEVEFGRSLKSVIEEEARSSANELEAVLLGGPMGSLLFPEEWDVPLCYDALAKRGIRLGHGGIVALRQGIDWHALLGHWLGFMTRESCGKCVPCREGSRQARDQFVRGDATAARLDATLALIENASLCGFGKGAPGPARKLLARKGDAVLEKRG